MLDQAKLISVGAALETQNKKSSEEKIHLFYGTIKLEFLGGLLTDYIAEAEINAQY